MSLDSGELLCPSKSTVYICFDIILFQTRHTASCNRMSIRAIPFTKTWVFRSSSFVLLLVLYGSNFYSRCPGVNARKLRRLVVAVGKHLGKRSKENLLLVYMFDRYHFPFPLPFLLAMSFNDTCQNIPPDCVRRLCLKTTREFIKFKCAQRIYH